MNIFAPENIGHNILCLIEKDGDQVKYLIKWTHAIVGLTIVRKTFNLKPLAHSNVYTEDISPGWTIVEVGI